MDTNNWWDENEHPKEVDKDKEKFSQILQGSWKHLSSESKKSFEKQVNKRAKVMRNKAETGEKFCFTSSVTRDGTWPAAKEGSVGRGAAKLSDDNVGNRMLRSMGWNPGEGLGKNCTGRVSPVQAVVRPKLQGLGC